MERSPDPKHIFDRDPLLIPRLFVAPRPPWYKRPRWLFASALSLSAVSTVAVLVALYGPRGAAERLGDAGLAIVHAYTRLFSGPATPY